MYISTLLLTILPLLRLSFSAQAPKELTELQCKDKEYVEYNLQNLDQPRTLRKKKVCCRPNTEAIITQFREVFPYHKDIVYVCQDYSPNLALCRNIGTIFCCEYFTFYSVKKPHKKFEPGVGYSCYNAKSELEESDAETGNDRQEDQQGFGILRQKQKGKKRGPSNSAKSRVEVQPRPSLEQPNSVPEPAAVPQIFPDPSSGSY